MKFYNVYNLVKKYLKTRFSSKHINYCGYREVQLNDIELANFYEKIFPSNINTWQLKNNEYLLIKNNDNAIIDKYRWHNGKYNIVPFHKAESKMFGK